MVKKSGYDLDTVSSPGKDSLEFGSFGREFGGIQALKILKVLLFPLDGRVFFEVAELESVPVGFPLFKADEE